jgi:cytochrome c biogenesis protein CcmG, thiol:disulfide interchange protein DsbE
MPTSYNSAEPQEDSASAIPPETPALLKAPVPTPQRKLTPGRVITLVLVIATIAILLRALLTPTGETRRATTSGTPGPAAPLVDHYAPNATLLDLHNKRVTLSSWRGKVVVLNFWYVACQPCQSEMPALQKAYDADYSKGLVVVGINTSDDAVSITQFVKALGITYPILRDIGQRSTIEYRVDDTPTSFIIDRQGVIRYRVIGPLDQSTFATDTSLLLSPS